MRSWGDPQQASELGLKGRASFRYKGVGGGGGETYGTSRFSPPTSAVTTSYLFCHESRLPLFIPASALIQATDISHLDDGNTFLIGLLSTNRVSFQCLPQAFEGWLPAWGTGSPVVSPRKRRNTGEQEIWESGRMFVWLSSMRWVRHPGQGFFKAMKVQGWVFSTQTKWSRP